MTATLYPVSGATIDIGVAISAQTTDFAASDFDSQSWVNIPWWSAGGSFGDAASEIDIDFIDAARTQKLKGVRNSGNMDCVFGIDASSDGQATLYGAETTDENYAFRITYASGAIRYFIAKVMTVTEDLSGPNNTLMLTATLAINSNIVRA